MSSDKIVVLRDFARIGEWIGVYKAFNVPQNIWNHYLNLALHQEQATEHKYGIVFIENGSVVCSLWIPTNSIQSFLMLFPFAGETGGIYTFRREPRYLAQTG